MCCLLQRHRRVRASDVAHPPPIVKKLQKNRLLKRKVMVTTIVPMIIAAFVWISHQIMSYPKLMGVSIHTAFPALKSGRNAKILVLSANRVSPRLSVFINSRSAERTVTLPLKKMSRKSRRETKEQTIGPIIPFMDSLLIWRLMGCMV
jgi:hypothetical protein